MTAPRNSDDRDTLAATILAHSSDVVAIMDTAGMISFASAAAVPMLGYPDGELVGRSAFDLVHPDDQVAAFEGFQSTTSSSDSRSTPLLVRLLCANGNWLQTEVIATNHIDDPQVAGLLLTIRDVSESMRTDRALRESEEHYRLIVELAQEGIWVVDEGAVTTYANRAMAEMLGTTVRALIGRSVFDFMDEAGQAEARVELERRRSGIADRDVRLITPDGRSVWTRMNASPMRSHDGDYRGAIALVTDVTERRCLEEQLAREARVDALTGVANRNTLFDVLEVEMARRRTCGVLFADLDNFKSINDTYGHSAGDETLRVVAERIMNVIRTNDTLARVGGDEFVVVSAPVRDADEAIAISERIPPTLREPIRVGGNSIPVAMSIGVAVTEDGDTSDSILARADDALYRAKRAGRSRIEVAVRSSE